MDPFFEAPNGPGRLLARAGRAVAVCRQRAAGGRDPMLKNKQIYFFDSFGKKPGDMIGNFMNRIYNFMSKKYDTKTVDKETLNSLLENDNSDSDIDLKYNKIQHQFKNTECGVYSMNFIIRLVSGESFDNITNNITEDKEMQSCRMVYFR